MLGDVLMNQNLLIENLVVLVNSNFSTNRKISENLDKCTRDLTLVLEAVFKDIDSKTTVFTNRIANRFWYNERSQLKTSDVEIKVYNFLLNELKKILNNDDYQHAENSINTLLRIIQNGPEINDFGTKISQDVLKAEHCQRNWDHEFIFPEDDLDALIKVATTMPTKQNRDYYKLIVSTDRLFNKKIYSLADDPENPDTPERNSQVNANVLFLYINNKDFKNKNNMFKDDHDYNTSMSVGISSGALALAAAQMDYRIGFCQCFLNSEIKKELEKKNIILDPKENVFLLVGVGKPNNDFPWFSLVNDETNTLKRNISTLKKLINVYRF
jgi:nitroreductase